MKLKRTQKKNNIHDYETMHIGIAADHGGFELKVQLLAALTFAGYMVKDFGVWKLVKILLNADFKAEEWVTRCLAKVVVLGKWKA